MAAAILGSGLLGAGMLISITFNMGSDLSSIVNSEYGQPMATIFLNSLGRKGFFEIWAIFILVQFCMGQSMSLASSRQGACLPPVAL